MCVLTLEGAPIPQERRTALLQFYEINAHKMAEGYNLFFDFLKFLIGIGTSVIVAVALHARFSDIVTIPVFLLLIGGGILTLCFSATLITSQALSFLEFHLFNASIEAQLGLTEIGRSSVRWKAAEAISDRMGSLRRASRFLNAGLQHYWILMIWRLAILNSLAVGVLAAASFIPYSRFLMLAPVVFIVVAVCCYYGLRSLLRKEYALRILQPHENGLGGSRRTGCPREEGMTQQSSSERHDIHRSVVARKQDDHPEAQGSPPDLMEFYNMLNSRREAINDRVWTQLNFSVTAALALGAVAAGLALQYSCTIRLDPHFLIPLELMLYGAIVTLVIGAFSLKKQHRNLFEVIAIQSRVEDELALNQKGSAKVFPGESSRLPKRYASVDREYRKDGAAYLHFIDKSIADMQSVTWYQRAILWGLWAVLTALMLILPFVSLWPGSACP